MRSRGLPPAPGRESRSLGRRAPGRSWVAAAFLVAALSMGLAYLSGAADGPFPHATHEGLFPVCVACHWGIATDDPDSAFTVGPADCAGCHDGDLLDKVTWTPYTPAATNLVDFSHELHVTEMEIECATCHQAAQSKNRMDVGRPRPEACLTCHDAPEHLSRKAECRTCHVPLPKAAGLSVAQIAAFPEPSEHKSPDFLLEHGAVAGKDLERCATCHTREACRTCHLNASQVEAIQSLASDPREAEVWSGRPGRWPSPPSHAAPNWKMVHAAAARDSIQTCGNCHARSSCTRCHGAKGPPGAEQLPQAQPGGPQGAPTR